MSLELTRNKKFKLKKIERPMYVRNIDNTFNKEGPIKYTIEVKIFYKEHRERTEIDIIERQKWNVILDMLWLSYHNYEIYWKTEKVKMTRCLEEYGE